MKRAVLCAAAVAAAAGLVTPFGAAGHHRTDHVESGTPGQLSIVADPDPVPWGDSVRISGRLSGPDNEGRTVELQHDPHPYGTEYEPLPLARTTTDVQGYYAFAIAPSRNTNYRTIVPADEPRFSANVKVHVQMHINRRVTDRTPRRGQRITFYGAVAPAHDGQMIRLQRRDSQGVWRTVARTALRDAGDEYPNNSFYERRVRIRRDGTWRVQVRNDGDHVGKNSRPVRLDVHRRRL